MGGTIYSAGHGTATGDAFTAVLACAGVRLLADIRSAPGSRRNPQFGAGAPRARIHRTPVWASRRSAATQTA